MRRFLVILLCLMLVITACGTKEKVPEGMSKEFYHAMLEMDEEIQKSLETKYNDLYPSKNEKYGEVFRKYILPVVKDELPKELINEMREKGYNLDNDKEMTEKEIFTTKVLNETILDLSIFLTFYNEDNNSDLIKESQNNFKEKYKQYKALLELQ